MVKPAILLFAITAVTPLPPWSPTRGSDRDRDCGRTGGVVCPLPKDQYRICKKYWGDRATDIDLIEFCGPPPLFPVKKRSAQ